MRKWIRLVGYVLIGASLVIFGVQWYRTSENAKVEQEILNIEQTVTDTTPDNPTPGPTDEIDYQRINHAYFDVNPDYAGYISISKLNIFYPYVQGNDNKYYLRHNIKREFSYHGAIFMDYRNQLDFSDNHTVLYGHSMLDGTMFRGLDKLKNKVNYSDDLVISIRTLNETRRYKIFSVYLANADVTRLSIPANHRDVKELAEFYRKKSRYDTGVDISEIDHILTLASCNYDLDNGRIIVHAIRIDN